jgi:hypothetical protein
VQSTPPWTKLQPQGQTLVVRPLFKERQRIYDNTIDGLRQVMAIKSRAVLPYLVPQLIAAPVNTRALASLAPVSGDALHRHLVSTYGRVCGTARSCYCTSRVVEFNSEKPYVYVLNKVRA